MLAKRAADHRGAAGSSTADAGTCWRVRELTDKRWFEITF